MEVIARSWDGWEARRHETTHTYDLGGGRRAEIIKTYFLEYRDGVYQGMELESTRHRFEGMSEAAQADFLAALESRDPSALAQWFGAPTLDTDPLLATV